MPGPCRPAPHAGSLPRRTMAAPQGRILDMHARLLYAQTQIDPDIRLRLERYFAPVKR